MIQNDICIRYYINIKMHIDEIGILNSADIEDFLF